MIKQSNNQFTFQIFLEVLTNSLSSKLTFSCCLIKCDLYAAWNLTIRG